MASQVEETFTTLSNRAKEEEAKNLQAEEEEEKTSTSNQSSRTDAYTIEEHDKIMQEIEETLIKIGLRDQSSPEESN
jgi:DNA repair photolyase